MLLYTRVILINFFGGFILWQFQTNMLAEEETQCLPQL